MIFIILLCYQWKISQTQAEISLTLNRKFRKVTRVFRIRGNFPKKKQGEIFLSLNCKILKIARVFRIREKIRKHKRKFILR